MSQQLSPEIFEELRERILDALRPALTRAEISALSGSFSVDDCSLSTGSCGPFDCIEIIEDEDMENPTIRFEEIRIVQGRRGQGLGSIVMTAFVDFAREKGLDANLSASPLEQFGDPERDASMKRLVRYYERFGFEDDGFGNMQALNVPAESRVMSW